MTRFEKLKEMSIDDIAEWWVNNITCSDCPIIEECAGSSGLGNCKNRVKGYLNAEAPDKNAVCSSCAIDFAEDE